LVGFFALILLPKARKRGNLTERPEFIRGNTKQITSLFLMEECSKTGINYPFYINVF